MTTVDRGYSGTMPAATERDDETYLDFVEGVRVFTQAKVFPVMQDRGTNAVQEYEARAGHKISGIADTRAALDNVPVVAARNRFMRSSQEMMWNGVIDTYRRREPELLRELEIADRSGPGSVEYDPNFKFPEYFSKVEFHIQPGNYHADPLAGYIYHYGTKVFFTGRNNNDEVQRGLVNIQPAPSDGQVRRILDMACSSGQSATALKERYPQAEVWGIDAGAPMVRYAHKRAVDMGLDIHFAQRLAEETKFPDNYFDIVHAFILFHEIPLHIQEQTVREAARVLRPGGIFIVEDFPNRKYVGGNPLADYTRDFDMNDNGEPYSSEFVYSDFPGTLRKYFREVNESYTDKSWLPMRVATK